MRNKCLFSLGLVFVISLTSMVAFAFSFVGTPADEADSRDIIVQSMISDEANATPTATSVATTAPEQETEKAERSKIGSMDWDSDDAYRLAKIAMAEAESEDTEGKALVMLVVLNRVYLYETDKHNIPITGNILIVGEEWTGDGIDFCGIEESVFKILELQLNNMIMAMKATMEVLK